MPLPALGDVEDAGDRRRGLLPGGGGVFECGAGHGRSFHGLREKRARRVRKGRGEGKAHTCREGRMSAKEPLAVVQERWCGKADAWFIGGDLKW
ncbi:hypothetical protein SGFS_012230 [Streptomyces graminofaciens]|uniref:Uncharacterized protein n=1 Tax=Streptomyces graminofaciens TaxID=68212 RepID=A0ABM7F2G2_9ACTN|nr:hypothetical protein SGFS_012230 [Streptomyces graminofaciens]